MAENATNTATIGEKSMIIINEEFKAIFERYPHPNLPLLEQDLIKNGCRDALVLWNGILIDGYNRFNICQKHNIPFKTISYEFADREEAHAWILDNQFQRRNLPEFAYIELKQELKQKLLEIGRQKQKEAGEQFGKAHPKQEVLSTIDKSYNQHNTRDQIANDLNISTGKLAMAEVVINKAPEKVKEKVRSGEISINQAYKEVKKADKLAIRAKLAEAGINKKIDIDFRLGDFEEVFADIPANSVDCIITDPPYPAEYLECWSKLSKFASHVLKPNGYCIAYSGQMYLPEVLKRMAEHLDYYWTFSMYLKGQTQLVNAVNLICRWRPVLVYQKGKKKLVNTFQDYFVSEEREKTEHDWQQSQSGIDYLIEMFTNPAELIIDPFAGSGTTLIVAKEKGRNVKGAEIDQETYNIAKTKL